MILENEKIKQALEYIKEEDPATTQDTLNMCQIPAPSYKEEKKRSISGSGSGRSGLGMSGLTLLEMCLVSGREQVKDQV